MIWRILCSKVHSPLLLPLAHKNCPGLVSIPSSHPVHSPVPLAHLLAPEEIAAPLTALAPKMDKDQNKPARNDFYPFSSMSVPQEQHTCFSGVKHTHPANTQARRAPCRQGPQPVWTKSTGGAQERVKDEDTASHQLHNKEKVGVESPTRQLIKPDIFKLKVW